ncbi:MAG: methyltransferase domain-containing protein [Flavobacteriales bacterium]|nr:methyltransferase domain-containing protein [Flavobacteriales bacterium]MCB9334594.1 methyltransferase domain-containing protein [Flavobacteriales bacterium]
MVKSYDALGNALKDYFFKNDFEDITVISDISEDDIIPVDYLFRNYLEMPLIERKALNLCKGKVLDVGAASGCHSLILEEKNLAVKSIDISEGAIEVMKARGLKNAELQDFYQLTDEQFDTILLLMNGIGIAQNMENLPAFLQQCKKLLAQGGQILLDSSDIKYMFEEEDGSMWVDMNKAYYGEVNYQMQYKNCLTEPFDWLFVDFKTLQEAAKKEGFKTELIAKGEHFDYLARLTL